MTMFLDPKVEFELKLGAKVTLPEREYKRAIRAGEQRDRLNFSDNRGGGTDKSKHMKGAMAEAMTLYILKIDRGPTVYKDHARDEPDIKETHPMIEVKAGSPVVQKSKLRDKLLYVVWEVDKNDISTGKISAIAMGYDIQEHHTMPPPEWHYRGNSARQNWVIPDRYDSFIVQFKRTRNERD